MNVNPLRLSVPLAAFLVLSAAGPRAEGAAPPSPADALIGKWWSTVAAPHETIELGLEIRRDPAGALGASITQPGANYFDMKIPGEVQFTDGHVTVPGLGLVVTLKDNRLNGTFGRSHVPIELHRVDALPQRSGPPSLKTGPGPKWQTRLNGQVFASPVVADGVAYVGTTGGVFQAIRASDGSFVWTFPAGRAILGAARVTGDAVYFTCDNGYLFKLDRASGKESWRYDLGDDRAPRILGHPTVYDWDWHGARPLVANGVVYVGAADGGFHAVDATSGARRFRVTTGDRIRGGASTDGTRIYVGSADHFLYAFDPLSGRELWKHDTLAPVEDEPLVAGASVIIGNRGTGLLAIAAATGERLWTTTFWGSWLESTATIEGGVIYVGSSDLGRVSAIDPADGRVLWRTNVYGWSFGTPLVVGPYIYAGAAGGAPYMFPHVASFNVLDRATGKLVERWPLPDSSGAHQWGIAGSLALAGDTVVATTIDGSIYGFPLRGNEATR
jgi:outer membrane protein assembly factor BamB